MAAMTLRKVIPFVALLASGAWAQATCGTGFDWNKNSLEQDPCEFGSLLDASCRNLPVYTYPVLNSSEYYVAPQATHTGDLMCDCNTVMYSIYMACALCQGGQIYSWTSWVTQCESVYISQYPASIAQGTAIPYWAFYNITSLPNEEFDQNVAMSVGQDPEAFPVTTTTTLPHSTGGTYSSGGGGSSSNTGVIVGVSVGVVVLVIKIILIIMYRRWRRQRRMAMVQTASQVVGGILADKQQRTSTYQVPNLNMNQSPPPMPMSPPPMGMQPPLMGMPPSQGMHPMSPTYTGPPLSPTNTGGLPAYNPEDPSTFPSQSPPNSMAYTTAPDRRGAYTGVPEV